MKKLIQAILAIFLLIGISLPVSAMMDVGQGNMQGSSPMQKMHQMHKQKMMQMKDGVIYQQHKEMQMMHKKMQKDMMQQPEMMQSMMQQREMMSGMGCHKRESVKGQ